MPTIHKEKERLKKIKFSSRTGFNSKLIRLRYITLSKFFKGSNCLELGSADGQGTQILLPYFKRIVAVDGSRKLIKALRRNLPSKKLIPRACLFEELTPNEKFDTIVMGHILEHISDPVALLRCAKQWLNPNGVLLVDVPNADSLHRQIGVKMGLLKKCVELNTEDKRVGHRRVYTIRSFRADLRKARLKIHTMGGIFLKPFSNSQMEKFFDEKMVKAFYELGSEYPIIAAEIYAICGLPGSKL